MAGTSEKRSRGVCLGKHRTRYVRYFRDAAVYDGLWFLSGLADFAELAVAEGRSTLALRLASAVETLGEASGYILQPTERRLLERSIATDRQALTREEAAAAWEEGQHLTPQQALAEAA